MKLPEKPFLKINSKTTATYYNVDRTLAEIVQFCQEVHDYLEAKEKAEPYELQDLLADVRDEVDEQTKTITLPKPEWWGSVTTSYDCQSYLDALSAASKASGITYKLED